jgi:hypothetical protein
MKGCIALALKELIEEKFGKEKWQKALTDAGLDEEPLILPISDVDDGVVMGVIKSVCNVCGLTLQEAADAFGDYWVNVYSQRVYPSHYEGIKSAKEFILKMDDVHVSATKNMPNAHPPRFDYEWKDDATLIMTYKSERGLIDIMVGLIKGVGKLYKENLRVNKVGDNKVEITFF